MWIELSEKLFTFNASSFSLDVNVASFLRSRAAIALDFGSCAYINSDLMPAILSELVEKASTAVNQTLVEQLKAEISRYDTQIRKVTDDNARLVQQLSSSNAEVTSLKKQLADAVRTIESVTSDNMKLRNVLQNTSSSRVDVGQHERLVQELQWLKAQHAEALTSLKVIEEENERLEEEMSTLKGQLKVAQALKVE